MEIRLAAWKLEVCKLPLRQDTKPVSYHSDSLTVHTRHAVDVHGYISNKAYKL